MSGPTLTAHYSTTHLPSFVNIGGTLLADESVRDFHDHASSASSTSFPFAFRFLRGFTPVCVAPASGISCAAFAGMPWGSGAVMVRVRSTATGIVGSRGSERARCKPVLTKNLPRARNGNRAASRKRAPALRRLPRGGGDFTSLRGGR